MIVSPKNGTHPYTVIDGIVTNATQNGLFIQTSSIIEKGKVYFSYKDARSNATLYFDCDVLRTDLNGIAVTYQLLSDSNQAHADGRYKWICASVSKGRLLDCYS
jgi:hypothetical protein